MAATPAAAAAAAIVLHRVLVARSAAAIPLHRAPARRRRWRGPLRSLPPEGKMLGVAVELRASGSFELGFCSTM